MRSYSGCSQIPYFKHYGNNTIHMSDTSDCTRFTVVKAFIDPNFATENESKTNKEGSSHEAENESVHLEVSHWVQVNYDRDNYNGEISSITGDGYKVNVMHRSGNCWKWPNIAAENFYKFQENVKVILPPVAVGSRGQYSLEN